MKKALPISLVLLLGFSLTLLGAEGGSVPFTDDTGKIRVPEDYTSWEFLGAWSIAAKGDDAKGAKELHNVYASKGTIEAFRKTGQFPDKAILVKEILTAETGRLTRPQRGKTTVAGRLGSGLQGRQRAASRWKGRCRR